MLGKQILKQKRAISKRIRKGRSVIVIRGFQLQSWNAEVSDFYYHESRQAGAKTQFRKSQVEICKMRASAPTKTVFS